jgi:uncharacterized membrane protein
MESKCVAVTGLNVMGKRFWEIDALRGLAIVMMVFFHLVCDLDYFDIWAVDRHSGLWPYFRCVIATMFILLVGVSLTLSSSRAKKAQVIGGKPFTSYLKRGLMTFSLGLLITLVTRLFLRERFVVFGILNFIGVSIVLAYPFLELRFRNLVLGVLLIALGMHLWQFTFEFPWLVWLGFKSAQIYQTIDYFPILPWFGLVLIGLFLGNLLYPDYTRKFNLYDLSDFPPIRSLCFLGRHSLIIYLIHQPVLLALLFLFAILS